MTEKEWNECANPKMIWDFIRDNVSDRKLRLLACACCRHSWDILDVDAKPIVKMVEDLVDGITDLVAVKISLLELSSNRIDEFVDDDDGTDLEPWRVKLLEDYESLHDADIEDIQVEATQEGFWVPEILILPSADYSQYSRLNFAV